MSKVRFSCLVLVMLVATGCTPSEQPPGEPGYYDLGDFRREVTSSNPEAATWFARGYTQCYAFNHEEAVRCFEKALELEPDMAMAHWGIAYALGPNYNNPFVEPEVAERAHAEIQKALELASTASAVEQDLIAAMATRYASPPPEDRAELDAAYADAMHGVQERHPEDPDVAALYAESVMQLRPWNLWSKDGEPAPGTPELVAMLEASLAKWPDHPALCHLYIHTMEPSPEPGKAVPAANALRGRVPGAGHLVHMPSHIDVLVGDYGAVIEANQKAILEDEKFVEREGRMNFFTLYRVHNLHFLVYGAMFDGQNELAAQAAKRIKDEIPAELLVQYADWVEAFMPTDLHVLVRFGRWGQILNEPAPPEDQPYSTAIWHYARTLALASLGRVEQAESELAALERAIPNVPESRLLFQNSCADILEIALAMSRGEVAYRKGDFEPAFAHLREAVELDDALNYDEPWGWMQPARHALGALLLEQKRYDEAAAVYRADLKRHPRNGWALHGLTEALRERGETTEAAAHEAALDQAWKRADTKLTASCFCRVGSPVGN